MASNSGLCVQANLREALLDQSLEYSRTYLTALVTVMTHGVDPAVSKGPPLPPTLEVPAQLECVELLLRPLEEHRGGPEFLSQALCSASLLLSQRSVCTFTLLITAWKDLTVQ